MESAMHLKRWLTGIIAVPILIYIIGFGPRWAFYMLLYLGTIGGLIEFYKITSSDLPGPLRYSIYFLISLLFVVIYQRQILLAQFIIVLFSFVPMSFFMFTHPSPDKQSTGRISMAVAGPIYIGIPLSMLVHIDKYYPDNGSIWIFFLLVVIFASDTGAFYFGRLFGRHKLYEAISPGKTWEGAMGGVISSIIAAIWFLHIFQLHRITPGILGLVAALSIVGQIGDLAESMLKRNHGVKDSGWILPGHGGILDRIDGLLFAIPVLYLYLNINLI